MHVLLIKMSSMGDLIHVLPAITDASKRNPNLTFDWVIEENFSEIASWHPSIGKILPSAHRRWRKNLCKSSQEMFQFAKKLRAKTYDMVIDGQTNWKSALITRLAKGLRVGLDKYSVREYAAHFAYQKSYNVTRNQHASEVLRAFFAKAFGYERPLTPPDFGIDISRLGTLSYELPSEYFVFIHAASWKTKLWPEKYFANLLSRAGLIDMPVYLPWGSKKEKERAERIAKGHKNARVLPKLSLSEIALILRGAKAVVTVDTGLGHLSGALGTKTIGVYGPTNPRLVGSIGKNVLQMASDFACAPCNKARCRYQGPCSEKPACFTKVTPDAVWEALLNSLQMKRCTQATFHESQLGPRL